ncbi:HAMP domain-containing sensor histidine kinase [uncultured Tateyamaria sp.]|uniref:sensor histidine kinase n=1 Tax=uncultured Tateyamaria sp. TaxID=455651 RepID=UPI002628617C|nr:HAMP domain-containing sensor histidine kinase [uncultured Tateyamaria sp.]
MKPIDLDAVDPTLAFAGPFHDIRNVISTLQMDIDTLANGSQSRVCQRLTRMERCINRCMDICDAALRQRHEVNSELINLFPIAQEVASDLNALGSGKIIEVSSESKHATAFVRKSYIYRVIFNLADNARKAVLPSKSGIVQIHIGFDLETRLLYIDIRDNGPGMPDRFCLSPNTVSFSTKGCAPVHGVGLRNVRYLVEAMGIRMTTSLIKPHGTNIRLTFPETSRP